MTSEDGHSVFSKGRPNKFLDRSNLLDLFFNHSLQDKVAEAEAALLFLKAALLFPATFIGLIKYISFSL